MAKRKYLIVNLKKKKTEPNIKKNEDKFFFIVK